MQIHSVRSPLITDRPYFHSPLHNSLITVDRFSSHRWPVHCVSFFQWCRTAVPFLSRRCSCHWQGLPFTKPSHADSKTSDWRPTDCKMYHKVTSSPSRWIPKPKSMPRILNRHERDCTCFCVTAPNRASIAIAIETRVAHGVNMYFFLLITTACAQSWKEPGGLNTFLSCIVKQGTPHLPFTHRKWTKSTQRSGQNSSVRCHFNFATGCKARKC